MAVALEMTSVEQQMDTKSSREDSVESDGRSENVVQVKAQVMERDDNRGGWVPIHGGGISVVGLHTMSSVEDLDTVQYRVDAKRVKDHANLLNCVLKKDLAYTKGNPLFHHWQTQGQKFGLTFHSSSDAHAFEQWIKNAKQQMLDKFGDSEDQQDIASMDITFVPVKESVSLPGSRARTPSPGFPNRIIPRLPNSYMSHPSSYPGLNLYNVRPQSHKQPTNDSVTSESLLLKKYMGTAGLPLESVDSHTVPCRYVLFNEKRLAREELSLTEFSLVDPSYVQFSKSDMVGQKDSKYDQMPHDYSYPVLESVGCSQAAGNTCHRQLTPSSSSQRSLDVMAVQLPVAHKSKKNRRDKRASRHLVNHQRLRCVYCQELFVISDNRRGQCPYGTDKCVSCIEVASCMMCARGVVYHLASDEEGDYGQVCVCDSSDRRNRRKWVLLTLLSCVLPCLWCYRPLMACHRCGVKRGHCGARHKAE